MIQTSGCCGFVVRESLRGEEGKRGPGREVGEGGERVDPELKVHERPMLLLVPVA